MKAIKTLLVYLLSIPRFIEFIAILALCWILYLCGVLKPDFCDEYSIED